MTMAANPLTRNPKAQETKNAVFDVIVRDYTKSTATFSLSAGQGINKITKQIPVEITIPEFLVAPDPATLKEKKGNNVCLDMYYVINTKSTREYDVELDISYKNAIIPESLIVDYVSSVSGKAPLVREFDGNPYCVPADKTYSIKGYLYQATEGVFVDTAAKSTEITET